MKRLIEDYIVIHNYYQKPPVQRPITATMEELADIWFCSQRNAKFILTKLAGAGWVSFSPGRGRGNKSQLTFLKSIDDVAFAEAIALFQSGRMTEGLELAALYGTPLLKNRLLHWLNQYFGYEKQESEKLVQDLIRLPMFRTFNTMVPAKAFFDFDVHLIRQVYDTIVSYDYSSDKAIGKLAHHWEWKKGKTEWTFFLKKGVRFHNGQELTSADIHHTFSLLLQQDYEQYWLVRNICSIVCLDRYTIRFHLSQPNELFLQYLSFPALSIIPSGSTGFIGTGPFQVHTYESNCVILEDNPNYYEGRPFVDRFEILNVPKEYEKDLLSGTNSIFVNTGEGNYFGTPEHELIEGIYEGSTLFTFNLRRQTGPQVNLSFRKAVNILIDRKKLIADLGLPRMIPAYSFERSQSLLATPKIGTDEQIQTLLQSAGYRGEIVQLYTYDRHQLDAEWIKEEAARHGISFDITILGWNEILKQETIEHADCILFEAVWGEQDMSKLELYQSSYSFLRQHSSTETSAFVDSKIETMITKPSQNDRLHLFSEIEDRLISEEAVIFLVHKNIESTFHPSIKGVRLNAHGHVDFKNIWIKPELAKKGE